MTADTLFDLADLAPAKPTYTVHCFWSPRCTHVVRETNPDVAGAAMERHYDEAHPQDIRRALGYLGVRITPAS